MRQLKTLAILISITLLTACKTPYAWFVEDKPILDGFLHGIIFYCIAAIALYIALTTRDSATRKINYVCAAILICGGVYKGYDYVTAPCTQEEVGGPGQMDSCPKYKTLG